jgi:serine/threonine protein kinase
MSTAASDRLLADKYVLTDQRREGGMATVVRAVEIGTGRSVAIKRMKARSDDRKQKESMRREIEALQSLKHTLTSSSSLMLVKMRMGLGSWFWSGWKKAFTTTSLQMDR